MADCTPANFSLHFSTQPTRLIANLTFVGYTVFAIACAASFAIYQKKSGNIKYTLQETFNAGGHKSMTLLASTIVSQWTWAANLLGAATAGVKVFIYTSLNLVTKHFYH